MRLSNSYSLVLTLSACAALLSACSVPQQPTPAPIATAQKGGTASSDRSQAPAVSRVIRSVESGAGDKTIKKIPENAQSGAKQVVNSASAWNEKCESMHSQIKVIRSPAHGSLELADFEQVVSRVAGARNCIGKKIEGTNVVYQSNAGFVGVDSFEVSITSPGGKTNVYRHVVNVISTR